MVWLMISVALGGVVVGLVVGAIAWLIVRFAAPRAVSVQVADEISNGRTILLMEDVPAGARLSPSEAA